MSNTACVPVMSSFARVKRQYELTRPIRGHKEKVRPLGERRHHRMASISMPDADTVVLSYYGRPFVTWKSDDSFMVQPPAYYSAYSAKHLSFFLPTRWMIGWNATRMTIKKGGMEYLMPEGSRFHFVKAGEDYELVNKPEAHAIRKKRGADSKLMKKCAAFFDWLTVVSAVDSHITLYESNFAKDALREQSGLKSDEWYRQQWVQYQSASTWPYTDERYQAMYDDYRMSGYIPCTMRHYQSSIRFNTVSSEKFMEWVEGDNADNWVLAMNLIAERAGKPRWSGQEQWFSLDVDAAAKFVMDVSRHVNRDSVFHLVSLPDGVVPSRTNEKYMRTHTFSS